MYTLKELTNIPTKCVQCYETNAKAHELLFQGVHLLQKYKCKNCETIYFNTPPIGHTLHYPISFSAGGKLTDYNVKAPNWLAVPLISSIRNDYTHNSSISFKINKTYKKVVLLNCLDNCYGHVIYKLLNAYRHLKDTPDIGLIIIIPKIFEWMIPDGAAEIWFVESHLSNLSKKILNFDSFIKSNLKKYDEVFISKTYLELDHSEIDFEIFFKKSRFDLKTFHNTPYNITFVLREDRFWLNSWLYSFLYMFTLKFKILHLFKKIFVQRQNHLVKKVANSINNKIKNPQFHAIGIGTSGNLTLSIIDKRTNNPNPNIEKEWCSIAASSHIVIGIHGSNMLVPSALAASIIDIIPRYKIPNIGQDILEPSRNSLCKILIRFLDEYSSANLVSSHILSIIRNPSIHQ